MFQWGPLFEHFARQVLTDQWQSHEQYWGGLAEGVVSLAPFSSRVSLP